VSPSLLSLARELELELLPTVTLLMVIPELSHPDTKAKEHQHHARRNLDGVKHLQSRVICPLEVEASELPISTRQSTHRFSCRALSFVQRHSAVVQPFKSLMEPEQAFLHYITFVVSPWWLHGFLGG